MDEQLEEHIKTLSFTTREEYLEWRREWKEKYHKLSTSIKKLSLTIADRARKSESNRITYAMRRTLKLLAREMVDIRLASKILSARQMEEQHVRTGN